MSTSVRYQLRCRECQTRWGNQPISFCQNCFAPLEVAYDLAAITQEISQRQNRKPRHQSLALQRTASAAGAV